MARKKKRVRTRTRKRRRTGLMGISSARSTGKSLSRTDLGLAVASYFGGTIVGAAIGKYSGVAGLLTGALGLYKKNLPITSIGAGMLFSSAVKVTTEGGSTTEGLNGTELSQAPERVKNYLKTLGKKMLLKSGEDEVNGLNGDENVSYFINPYAESQTQLDLRQLDRIQEEIAAMNGPVNGDMGDFDQNF